MQIAVWLEEAEHEPVPWNKPDLFPPGRYLFPELVKISHEVDAAILVFTEDDKVWYRKDLTAQPRDNVLIEYGLFAGRLGQEKTIMCVEGNPKIPADLLGINYIDVSPNKQYLAQLRLAEWLREIQPQHTNPVAGGGRRTKKDSARLELAVLKRIKDRGIADPDIDVFVATLSNDEELARKAMEQGGDRNISLGEVLQRHHRSLSRDKEYLDLLSRLLLAQQQK